MYTTTEARIALLPTCINVLCLLCSKEFLAKHISKKLRQGAS